MNGRPFAFHDSAACLVDEHGVVHAFSEEERFTGTKYGILEPPSNAAAFCLDKVKIGPGDVDVIAIGWDVPRLRVRFGNTWSSDSGRELIEALFGTDFAARTEARIEFVPHHLAHASVAYHGSGFDGAGVIVVDGAGEDESISIYRAESGRNLERLLVWPSTHSLGWMYEAATQWLGFHFLEAGKTMALAGFGRASNTGADLFTADGHDLTPSPRFAANDDVRQGWHEALSRIAGCSGPRRARDELHLDEASVRVAFAAQSAIEDVMTHLARLTRRMTGFDELCIAGGVALNSAANGQLGDPLYIPPVPHDAGVALGAAWVVSPPRHRGVLSAFLGSGVESPVAEVESPSSQFTAVELAERLVRGDIGAVVQGRAEIGPRALCHRSIIAVPTSTSVRDRLNEIKHREPWRPFGPVAMRTSAGGYWNTRLHLDRYMAGVTNMTDLGKRAAPAVCHVDGTTRPQTIRDSEAPLVASVLVALGKAGYPPILVNTSFNERGVPIVNSSEQALRAFERMELDFLVIDDRLWLRNGS